MGGVTHTISEEDTNCNGTASPPSEQHAVGENRNAMPRTRSAVPPETGPATGEIATTVVACTMEIGTASEKSTPLLVTAT